MKKICWIAFGAGLILGCSQEKQLFEPLEPQKAGIDFNNELTPTDDFNILDYLYFYNGGGVAIGDINNDSLPDIFFSGNQVKNRLYLNKGNLQFEDITESAGVGGNSEWNTGAVMADVNTDGLLDIYVCAMVGLRGLGGYNELYINNGDNTFSEQAGKYGLDHDSYSSSAAFLDYDKDGDLDVYLLNHAIHTQESFGHADLRNKRTYETGDKLLRNDDGKFVDVSEEAGIYGGVNGYGLGVAVSDFNKDGYPDIYVGNDFHEDDYYYINNGDGTFSEVLRSYFGHTTRFSMGNDVADVNGDGWPDLLSLDMLPEDEKVLKQSEGDDNVNIQRLRVERYGYHYQFSRNMLFMNNGTNKPFSETALMSGIAATDWSWSALFADYDQDGKQDLFVSNGIPKRPNDLDYIKFVSDEEIQAKIDETKLVDQKALDLMPAGAVQNYIFKGTDDLKFKDMSDAWLPQEKDFSAATALADLDLDGDLDVVINRIDDKPAIYINQTDETANYLKIKLKGSENNPFGLGARVYAYQNDKRQFKEFYTIRGFQASSEPMVHFGFGKASKVDSLVVVWPDSKSQTLRDIATNQTLSVDYKKATDRNMDVIDAGSKKIFTRVEDNLGLDFTHTEDRYVDFDRQKLIPYQVSDRGPATALGDLNGDNRTDVFFGGSKYEPVAYYEQGDTSFIKKELPVVEGDSVNEEVAALITDLNGDEKNDLIVGTGGADFYDKMKPLLDKYYLQEDGDMKSATIPKLYENASVICAHDYDSDGKQEVFIGNHAVSGDFGARPTSVLLEFDGQKWKQEDQEVMEALGMVTDAVWTDYDQDGNMDLLVVGEWMGPVFLRNVDGRLEWDNDLNELSGLWQSIEPFDIDADGDTDYMLGNWGLNSKFTASSSSPLKMYYGDIDQNGSTETILATEKEGAYYPLESLDQLAKQMVHLRKRFTAYKDFAGKTVEEVFTREELDLCKILEVNELRSGYLLNTEDGFVFRPFGNFVQTAPVMDILAHDFDGNGKKEALLAGNYFGVKPFHGRFDAFPGALIYDESTMIPGHELGLQLLNKSIRHLNVITFKGKEYLLVTFNNADVQVYEINL